MKWKDIDKRELIAEVKSIIEVETSVWAYRESYGGEEHCVGELEYADEAARSIVKHIEELMK